MKRLVQALIIAIPGLMAGSAAVQAGNTSCTGSLSGSTTGNIVVPSGASCTLSDAKVTGDVQVLQNASLIVDATQQATAIYRPISARPRSSKVA